MIKKLTLVVLSLITTTGLFAQEWVESMQDYNVNFYKVQEQFNTYWEKAEKKAEKDKKTMLQGEAGKGLGYAQYKRWEHFWEERVAPSGNRPNPTLLWQEAVAASGAVAGSNAGDWEAIGPFDAPNPPNSPYPGIGRINCITFHPTNGNIVWAGTPAGGLWKSTDGGVNWSTNTDQLPNLGVSAIAIDPQHPDTMFIATGDRDAGDTYSFGILKSTNGGLTWNATGLSFSIAQNVRACDLYIVPTNTQIVIAATRNGMYRTTDGGTTWTGVKAGPFNQIAEDPSNPNKLFAGTTGSPTRIYRSVDFGATFTQLSTGLPTSNINRVEIVVSPQDSNYVYAVYSNGSNGFDGLYQSTDGGDTWTQKSSTPNILGSSASGSGSGGQGWYDLCIAVSPTNKNQVFVGGVNIWRSNNQGAGWICVGSGYSSSVPYVHPDIHYFKWQPGTNHLYTGSDGGVFKTANTGTSWIPLYYNMNITQYYKISQSETNASILLGGAQDNGTHLKTGTFWDFVNGGDGMDNAIDHDNNMIMFASSQYGNFSRSINGGNSFYYLSALPPNGTGNWVTPIEIDPSNANKVYIGYDKVWRSIDKGITWAATSAQTVGTGNIDIMAIAPSNGQILYVSIDEKLYKSTNGGSSWTQLFSLSGTSRITGITISTVDANHVWVTRSGYISGQKVYESGNGGTSWGNRSGSLPNLPVNCIVYENGSLDGVYIGTDVGVYYRDATMTDWAPFYLGLPNVVVRDLEIHYPTNTLRAGTYGRGMWQTPLFSNFFNTPIADFTANPAAICTTNDIVTLTDKTAFGPSSWSWSIYPNTFTYVNGTSDSSQNPQVKFTAKGQYSITLTATNGYGSNTKTIAKIIAVGGQPLPFVEDFEDASYAEKWQTENPDNSKTWESALVGGSQPGNKAIAMDFYNYSAIGQVDGFVSPPINMEGFGNINLTFDHAYRKYNTLKNDSLKVYISTDCGTNWTLLQAYGENGSTNWVTGTNTTSIFVPSAAADWCGALGTASCKTINLNAYAGNDEVRIKFVAKNAFGNNLYLDNINITGTPNVKPIANFIGDTAGCTIGTFAFYDVSANNATSFAWSFPGASPATSTQANPVVTYTTGGNYTVTLIASNAAGADTIVQTAFVAVNQAVTPTLSVAASTTTICAQQTLILTPNVTNAGSNPMYVWYKNGNFRNINYGPLSINDAQNGDVYKCVMRPDLDCVTNDSVISNSITITVLPLPTVTLNSFASVCSGSPAFALTGGLPAGGTYSGTGVSNGNFDPQVAGVGGHIITYTINGTNGCTNQAIKNISVENGPPKPTVTYSNFILKASPISSSYTYQWFDAQGNAIQGATDTVYIPWYTGSYTVKLTFINGCENESEPFTVAQVGMSEETIANGLRLYPNPVKDVLHAEIVIHSKTELTLRIFDLAGREVYQQVKVVDAGVENLSIPVENLPAGAYIFEVRDNENVLTNRFMKQ